MASSSPSSSPPASHSLMLRSLLVRPAPLLLSFSLNKITSQPFSLVNLFPPLFLHRSRLIYSRSGNPIDGSWLWWALGTRSRSLAHDSIHSTSVLFANREGVLIHGAFVAGWYKLFMEKNEIRLLLATSERSGARRWLLNAVKPSPLRSVLPKIYGQRLDWGQRRSMLHACLGSDSNNLCAGESKVVAGSSVRKFTSYRPDCADACGCLRCSFSLIAWSGESGVEDPGHCFSSQILLVNWQKTDLRFVVMVSELQIWCFFVLDAICMLKLGFRGVKCITLQCFFCIPKMRADDDIAKDGDSCSFGSIHRWQVREPSLLIPRYNERESFRMSSVMRMRNLQLIHLLPHVHMPA